MKPRDFQRNNLVLRAGAPSFGPAAGRARPGRDRWRCGATVCAAALFVVGCGNSGQSPGTAIGSDGGGLDGTAGAGGVGFGGAGGAGGEAADAALFGSGGQGGGNGGGGGGQAGATARDAAADGDRTLDCLTGVYEGFYACGLHLDSLNSDEMDGTSIITVGPEMEGQAKITVDVDAKDTRGGLTRAELTGSAEGMFDCAEHRVRFTSGSARIAGEGLDVDLFLRLMGNPGGTSGSTGGWSDVEQRWLGFLMWIQSKGEEPPTCGGTWETLGPATSP